MNYLAELLFLFINILAADFQAQQFAAGRSISHFWWAFAFGVFIGVAWWLRDEDWYLACALLLERTWMFNPTLNLFRGKPFFYTGSGKGSSWLDDHFGKFYSYTFVVALAGFIFLQFFL